VDLAYQSRTRAIAILGGSVSAIELDGQPSSLTREGNAVLLPAGQHLVSFLR
jgi:hypothetical protein